MRIIAGFIKGKKILEPKDKLTRPLKDLAKESIFNIIKHSNFLDINIEKSKILDLFSGVGSFGLECLSRGADSVVFYENYSEALFILKKNIINCDYVKKTIIVSEDLFLDQALISIKKGYEIIFIDPPFKKKIHDLLEKVIKLNLLKDNGIIIIHRHKKDKEEFPKIFNILKEKCYGNSRIIFGN